MYNSELGQFVRFAFLANNDGEIVEGELRNSYVFDTAYEHHSFFTQVKIPVSLTAEKLEQNVTVNFSKSFSGTYSSITTEPENMLTFGPGRYYDTLTVSFNGRWNPDDENAVTFKLESTSDPEITIGNFFGLEKNDEFTINLGSILMRYSLQTGNRIKIEGLAGETVSFDVNFPDGLVKSELDSAEIVTVDNADFEYVLEKQPIADGDTKVTYNFTLTDSIDVDAFEYKAELSLNEIEGYSISGNRLLSVIKEKVGDADNSINTAAYFYNLSDAYYRLYGENWMYKGSDNQCDWKSFNTFTFPVKVDKDHPQAVIDNKGTPDTSDDEYYHAFKVGFNSPNEGNTTNPFNLKRWFTNESTDADVSPGFNIPEAIEFLPLNDTSTTQGDVKIIEQNLIVSARNDGPQYTLNIAGEGTYKEISDGVFKMVFELRVTNQELFGGTKVSYYVMYNTDNYTDPDPINGDCVSEMEL